MPLNEVPKYFSSETRSLIEAALEEAWQELSKDNLVDPLPARQKMRTTMVALAAVGKLKWFAVHPWRGALQAKQAATAARARMSGTAA